MLRFIGVRAMASLGFLFMLATTHAITLGQVDDFEDGTAQAWGGGANPTNIANGGPGGAGDSYLRISATGNPFGPGGRPAMFNTLQWSGDWITAGVRAVQLDIRNESSMQLSMRLVLFDDNTDTRWTSTVAQAIPADNVWRQVTFLVNQASLTRVRGSGSYANTMANVTRLMFRHDTGTPSQGGTPAEADVGFDNITALAGPTVLPGTYSFFRGIQVSGNLQSLLFSDDNRLVARPGFTLSTLEDPIQLIVEGEAPALTPTAVQLRVESHASTSNVRQRIYMFDFTTNQYEEVDNRIAPTSDTLVEVNMTSNPGRFIQKGTNLVRARVSWRQAGPVLVFPWQARTDMVNWTIVP